MTPDQTIKWTPDLTQTIETLRTITLNLDQQRIVKDIGYKLESNYETTLELDSHADTCVLGRDASSILDYTNLSPLWTMMSPSEVKLIGL